MPTVLASADEKGFAAFAAEVVENAIYAAIERRGTCRLMLSGGITAERVYDRWRSSATLPLDQLHLFFGDERCVPPDHPESNYRLVLNTMLKDRNPADYEIERIAAERSDLEGAARAYEALLPEVVDVLLLGMGIDGHIASLFPNDPALMSSDRTVVPVSGPKPPYNRLTITPLVVQNARQTVLLATGKTKGSVLREAFDSPADFLSLPVRLALDGILVLDPKAARILTN